MEPYNYNMGTLELQIQVKFRKWRNEVFEFTFFSCLLGEKQVLEEKYPKKSIIVLYSQTWL